MPCCRGNGCYSVGGRLPGEEVERLRWARFPTRRDRALYGPSVVRPCPALVSTATHVRSGKAARTREARRAFQRRSSFARLCRLCFSP